ncbi:MAG: branched-chain amino acid ABC transporter permease [Actinomycetota bacterium]|nr:branched-chain amino acid ABC transporter permease [Actinomycetota bacterium]
MTEFLQLLFQGVALGSQYALIALGFVVIYKATGVINFAQGGFVLVGAYLAYNFNQTWELPFPVALVLAMVAGALLGAIVERLLLRRMVGEPVFAVLMITIGLLFVLEQAATSVWGFDNLNLGDPWGIETVDVADLNLAVADLWTIGLAAAAMAAFFAFFRYTATGVAMRAAAVDQEAAAAQGIAAGRIFALAWAVAGAMAALGGITLAAGPAQLAPGISFVALAAFPAMILGGLDSPAGAVLGGIIIGVTQSLTAGYQPEYAEWLGTNFHIVMPYVVMILILLVRPYGISGTREVRRI